VSKYLFSRSSTLPLRLGFLPLVFGRVNGLKMPAVLFAVMVNGVPPLDVRDAVKLPAADEAIDGCLARLLPNLAPLPKGSS
jgi:hypothetical protein